MVAIHRLLVLVAGASLIAAVMVRLLPVPDFPVTPASLLAFAMACSLLGIALMLLEIYDKICERDQTPSE